jgi:hypothetical protein
MEIHQMGVYGDAEVVPSFGYAKPDHPPAPAATPPPIAKPPTYVGSAGPQRDPARS